VTPLGWRPPLLNLEGAICFGFTSTFGGDLILNPISLIRTIFIISLDKVASLDIASFFDILTSSVTARAAVSTVFSPQ
jgi:hypothetical protein